MLMDIFYVYICLYISEMNDSNSKSDVRKELGLFCYYKVFTVLMK